MTAAANNTFVYLGGEQEVPDGVTHAVIDRSVKNVRRNAFRDRRRLVSVMFHDGVEIIEVEAFSGSESLRSIKLLGVREIEEEAFVCCFALTDVEFGDRLETIGIQAFSCCPLRSIKIPSVRTVQQYAFSNCSVLMEAEFGNDLETIDCNSFVNCINLQRIVIPLKHNLFTFDRDEERYNQFRECPNLTTVDIVGTERIGNTISFLLMKSWKDEMNEEIGRINRVLPNAPAEEKTDLIRLWIRSVINRLDHFRAEHIRLLKDGMTLLELALWRAKLDEVKRPETAKIDSTIARSEQRITSGADIVIRNVVPFLQLDE